jgi:hypothetical protein
MPADGTLATRSHAKTAARPASKAATQNLADFTAAPNMIQPMSKLGHRDRAGLGMLPKSFRLGARKLDHLGGDVVARSPEGTDARESYDANPYASPYDHSAARTLARLPSGAA